MRRRGLEMSCWGTVFQSYECLWNSGPAQEELKPRAWIWKVSAVLACHGEAQSCR